MIEKIKLWFLYNKWNDIDEVDSYRVMKVRAEFPCGFYYFEAYKTARQILSVNGRWTTEYKIQPRKTLPKKYQNTKFHVTHWVYKKRR